MSPKELLYIEDALGHEKQLSSCCKDLAEQLSDGELKSFVNELSGKHQASFNKFLRSAYKIKEVFFMDDKLIMDNILTSTKSVCDLMMHGTIESSTTDVHSAFAEVAQRFALHAERNIQKDVTEGLVPV